MRLLLLLAALAGAPRPAVHLQLDDQKLVRREVAFASGGLRVLRTDVVRLPGVVLAHAPSGAEDVAIVCPAALPHTDEARGCPVFLVEADGRVRSLGVSALSAQLLPGGRFAFWTDTLELNVRAIGGGEITTLARHVLEPHLSADGRSFGVALAPTLDRVTPGASPCPAIVELATGKLRPLKGACDAQAPFVSPGGLALYASTRTGLASLYSQEQSAEAVQRTNVGRTSVDDKFIPVPSSELLFIDRSTAIFTARYEKSVLWRLDLATFAATPVGEGREPQLLDDGQGHLVPVAVRGAGKDAQLFRVDVKGGAR